MPAALKHESVLTSAEMRRVERVRDLEDAAGLELAATYEEFASKVEACRNSFRDFLGTAASDGRSVACYGAAAKGNTFFNFCGVTADDIGFVVDRSPHKQDHFLPGTHIPIVAPSELAARRPDYLVILPWNLRDEIVEQTACIRSWGGRHVVAVPEVEIIP